MSPPDAAIAALLEAFVAHFNRHGDAHAGPRLGPLLEQAGFNAVQIEMLGVHHWCPSGRGQVHDFCRFLLGLIEPELPAPRWQRGSRSVRSGLASWTNDAMGPSASAPIRGRGSAAAWEEGWPRPRPGEDEAISPEGMDFFERQWSSYRAIVEHDLMEHRAVAAATAVAIDAWLAARPGHAPAATMVDLGCGDLALLAPLLQRLPLGHYTGLDQAGVVLPLAHAALGEVPYPTQWLEGDLLAWAQGQLDPPNATAAPQSTDILHSSFAIHHLDSQAKGNFLEGARRRINPDGLFIWVDVFREPGESRTAYTERYMSRIRSSWHPLNAEQQAHVISHIGSFDIPADREAITAAARAAGWHWTWAWQGPHQAEALAVLTPA